MNIASFFTVKTALASAPESLPSKIGNASVPALSSFAVFEAKILSFPSASTAAFSSENSIEIPGAKKNYEVIANMKIATRRTLANADVFRRSFGLVKRFFKLNGLLKFRSIICSKANF